MDLKAFAFIGVFVVCICHGYASSSEVLKIEPNEVRSIELGTGDAIRIHAYARQSSIAASGESRTQFAISNPDSHGTVLIPIPPCSLARPITIAGPARIGFPTGMKQVVIYSFVTNSPFRTLLLSGTNREAVMVPIGKAFRHYGSFPLGSTNRNIGVSQRQPICELRIDDNLYQISVLESGFEIPGPATLEFRDFAPAMITYTLLDWRGEGSQEAVRWPPGRTSVRVERSPDLKNWESTYLEETSLDAENFFRLKIGE